MGLTSNTGPYNAAAEHFGADDPVMVKTPRQLYNFSLEFMLNENVRMEDDSFGRTFTFNRVVSVTMPDFDYGLVPINQYNRIRHVPTRMTPGPCNIVFYDTKDNQFQTMMKAYAGHYFGHPETGAHDLDPVNFSGYNILNSKFAAGEAQPFGAKTITPDSRFYYQQIRIHNKDSAQGGRTTVLYNCMVNTVQHTTFDYAQSGSASYSVSFQAEHVNIGVVSAELINAQQAQRQALQSTIPGTVANRGTVVNAIANNPTGQIQEYVGDIPPGTSLQNKDGKSFIVESNQAPEE
ncbi:MAG: hypothetical protein CMQ75_02030 [Gammaproteobacteria bacterium]|nr:hypothetical protein [Gammaproteobacteria bacterium]